MNAEQLQAIKARREAVGLLKLHTISRYQGGQLMPVCLIEADQIIGEAAPLYAEWFAEHAPADIDALLAEVERQREWIDYAKANTAAVTAERDALAAELAQARNDWSPPKLTPRDVSYLSIPEISDSEDY